VFHSRTKAITVTLLIAAVATPQGGHARVVSASVAQRKNLLRDAGLEFISMLELRAARGLFVGNRVRDRVQRAS
jgi:hypothetical protein